MRFKTVSTETPVLPKKLPEFVGTYALRPGLDLVFTVTADHLTLSPTGQPPDTLYAQTGTNGAVNAPPLHHGAFHGKAPRKP